MSLAIGTGLAAHIAQTVGEDITESILSVAPVIAECASNVRWNKESALALATRVKDYVAVVSTAVAHASTCDRDAEWQAGLEGFLVTLIDTQRQLQEQSSESYLAQILRRERDAEKLHTLSERVRNAFSVLMLQSQIHLHEMAEANVLSLQTRLDAITDRQRLPAATAPTLEFPGPSFPPPPPLYFGRSSETQILADILTGNSAAVIAVLGGPGMGKTSLALAAMHVPSVAAIYGTNRYFVACDAADEQPSCLNIVCSAFGISMTNVSTARKLLARTLTACRSLLVLDNFESVWDTPACRPDAENFLAFIASLHGPSLIVTLRGSERPHGVPWTHPFLPSLQPLDDESARQLFVAISGTHEHDEELTKLLLCLGNIPLALILMANVASYEPLDALLLRWDELKTAMLMRGDGRTRLSSLNVSVQLSLDSPRMKAVPEALQLIGVLSLLPQGVADSDLRFCSSSVSSGRRALSTLFRNALAYRTSENRVRVLAPIRTFVLANYPPAPEGVHSLCAVYFATAQQFSREVQITPASVSAVAPEVDNILSLIRFSLKTSSDPKPAVLATVGMSGLLNATGMGSFDILIRALAVARQNDLVDLVADLLFCWASLNFKVPGDPVELWTEARALYERTGNFSRAGSCTLEIGGFLPPAQSLEACGRLLSLAEENGNVDVAARCHFHLAGAYQRLGRNNEARARYQRAIDLCHRGLNSGFWRFHLADLDLDCGLVVPAIAQLKESISILEAARSRRGAGDAYTILGKCLLLQGDIPTAISHLRCAQDHYTAVAIVAAALDCLPHLVAAYMAARDELSAAEEIARAERLIQAPGEPGRAHFVQRLLQADSYVALARGDLSHARTTALASAMAARGRHLMRSTQYMLYVEAQALSILGQAEQQGSRRSEACVHQLVAVVIFRSLGIQVDTALALLHLAHALDDDAAMILLRSIMPPLQRFGFLPALAEALLHSAGIALRSAQPALALHRARRALHHFGCTQHLAGRAKAEAFLVECL